MSGDLSPRDVPAVAVLFPEAGLPLHVFEERYRALMAHCLEADGEFGVVLITRGSEVGGGDERVDVGTVARIANVAELDDGRMLVVATGVRRVRVAEWLPDDPYPRALVEDLPDRAGHLPGRGAGRGRGVVAPAAVAALGARRRAGPARTACGSPGTRRRSGWQLCDMAPLASLDQQRLLAADGLEARMGLLADLCDAMAGDVIGLLSGDGPTAGHGSPD